MKLKNLISTALCAVILTTLCTTQVSATSSSPSYTSLGTTTIFNKQVRLYHYNLTEADCFGKIGFRDINENEQVVFIKDTIAQDYYTFLLPSNDKYAYLDGDNTTTLGTGNLFDFTSTGGTYEKIRVKLTDFSDKFNADGTYTCKFTNATVNYHFSPLDSQNAIQGIIRSGGAYTAFKPNSNCEVEIYVSTEIGIPACFDSFGRSKDSNPNIPMTTSVGCSLKGLMIGDTDKSDKVSVSDATLMQKYLAELTTFDKLQLRAADANRDNKVDIKDSTYIQKYIADLL